MDYLPQAEQACLGDELPTSQIDAKDKHVIILGGGDTGADCLGTSLRQGCKSVKQFELLPRPPEARSGPGDRAVALLADDLPHQLRATRRPPKSPATEHPRLRRSTPRASPATKTAIVKKLHGVRLEWTKDRRPAGWQMKEIPGSEFELDCDLCLLAMGFVGPENRRPDRAARLEARPARQRRRSTTTT